VIEHFSGSADKIARAPFFSEARCRVLKGYDTISIKKYLEQGSGRPDQALSQPGASLEAAYRSALLAMGKSAMEAHASTSAELKKGLEEIASRFAERPDRDSVAKSEAEVSLLIDHWGLQTAEYMKQTAEEVKSLFVAIAKTADAVSERDQECTAKLQKLTGRLAGIARLDDMARMRDSILESASDLKTCVREIVENSVQTAVKFKSQIKTYEDRLEESEQRVRSDSLTKLLNRHGMESILARCVEEERKFSLVVVDLDNFKTVNDQYGHLTGDELLKQFAVELKTALRKSDLLARWGGDEFMLILEGPAEEAEPIVERMRRLVVGEYQLPVGAKTVRVRVEASFGIAGFTAGETAAELIARADLAMYTKKNPGRQKQSVFDRLTAEAVASS